MHTVEAERPTEDVDAFRKALRRNVPGHRSLMAMATFGPDIPTLRRILPKNTDIRPPVAAFDSAL